jgi:hypothetical protein
VEIRGIFDKKESVIYISLSSPAIDTSLLGRLGDANKNSLAEQVTLPIFFLR